MEEVSAGGASSVRRRWSEADRRRIVSESLEAGASVSVVARRHDVNTNLVFTWRRRQLAKQRQAASASGVVAAVVSSPVASAEGVVGRLASQAPGRMEIDLPGDCRVTVWHDVDMAALGRVIRTLRQR